MTRVLGISCDYHDAAACLVEDGEIVAAAQEERFTRIKHDAAFPRRAIAYCLAEAGDGALSAVAFYEKPLLKLHRILETSLGTAPRGLGVFTRAVPAWLRDKLWIEAKIERALRELGVTGDPPISYPEHHFSHAASAFFPSPFDSATVVTVDGVGEWATATIGIGEGRSLRLLEQIEFPHSLGLLYSAFTHFCGFEINDGEYELMGLAPYGEPRHAETILEHLLELAPDGSFRLHTERFGYLDGLEMTNSRFAELFGGDRRRRGDPITRREMDLAASIQAVTEEVILAVARHACEVTGQRRLCLAGGVALNCVANGRLLRSGIVDDLWVQPAAGDAGGALGAALAVWHGPLESPRTVDGVHDAMAGALLGPEFSDGQVRDFLDARGRSYETLEDDVEWAKRVAGLVSGGAIVGLFQGRMELGPRALGNRSIVADARSPDVQSRLNDAVKQREGFRPFAPSVLADRADDYFELGRPSPYMLLVAPVRAERRRPVDDQPGASLEARARAVRSEVPAVTHVDGSARVQTVSAEVNPRYHALISAFDSLTGCPMLLNTSFNVAGEPIVCTPEDAVRCFDRAGLDALSLGPFLLLRRARS